MFLSDANNLVRYLNAIKLDKYKHLSVVKDLYARRLGTDNTYVRTCYGIRIVDMYDGVISEFYGCNHDTYEVLRYMVRTNEHIDYEAMHRESEF